MFVSNQNALQKVNFVLRYKVAISKQPPPSWEGEEGCQYAERADRPMGRPSHDIFRRLASGLPRPSHVASAPVPCRVRDKLSLFHISA